MLLIPGDLWLVLPGIFMVLFGLLGILESRLIEQRFLKRFSSDPTGRLTPSSLAAEIHLSQEALLGLIFSLRGEGRLQAYFNSETGELIRASSADDLSCIVCGNPNVTSAFCEVCGSEHPSSLSELS